MTELRLDYSGLQRAFDEGQSAVSVIEAVYDRIEAGGLRPVWISLVPRAQAAERARQIEGIGRGALPLFGMPFAVKDNFDVAGMETTAGCPAFGYAADATAAAVRRLEEAGAILVGKTNMDQFATGLVGTRSPYGACASVFNDRYISGGSSAGSAVAVAAGLVSFALGTDTAGSGRVPAAFNNLVGLKPTRGLVSAAGVVPACRSLDCVSVFALTGGDAARVFAAVRGYDGADPFSRPDAADDAPAPWLGGPFRFGVPHADQWEFFGDAEASALYRQSIDRLAALGGAPVEFDLQPFREAAELLYAGPWVAERLAAVGPFLERHGAEVDPVVRGILAGGSHYDAKDAFLAQYRLERLRRQTGGTLDGLDVLLLPTAPTIYTKEQIAADPVRLNARLGTYTNFVNLLDLAAVAVPAGFRPDGLPFGVTLMGRARTDAALLALADRLHRAVGGTVGGTRTPLAETDTLPAPPAPPGCTLLAVVGAHLTGQPLNHQLTSRGARLAFAARTSPGYRLYALPGTVPPKPGLVRSPGFAGPGIALEVWAMPTTALGSFTEEVPPPLGIGSIELSSGQAVKGFICEPFALDGAVEITQFGGWAAYLAQ